MCSFAGGNVGIDGANANNIADIISIIGGNIGANISIEDANIGLNSANITIIASNIGNIGAIITTNSSSSACNLE